MVNLKVAPTKECLGGSVVRTQCLHCRGPGLIPVQGTKIPQAMQCSQKKKKEKKKEVEHLHLFTYSLFQCISFCVPTKRIHRLYVVLSNLTITQITDVKKSLQRNHNLNVIIMMPKKEPMAQLLEIWIEEPLFLIINLASNIQ